MTKSKSGVIPKGQVTLFDVLKSQNWIKMTAEQREEIEEILAEILIELVKEVGYCHELYKE